MNDTDQLTHISTSTKMTKKPTSKMRGGEAIKVCVRVRPLLPHERAKDEVIYYPTHGITEGLEVRPIPSSPSFKFKP